MENVMALNMAFGEELDDDGKVVAESAKPKSAKKIVATCPHCLNTIGNEYPQLGGDYEVIHHTQLLQHLVDEGKLVPVTPVEGIITYHDPATWAATTRSTHRRARSSPTSRACGTRRCTATRSAASAVAPVARGCGWRSGSASASTTSVSTKPFR